MLTILHLIPDGILCESCLGMICIRKHAHPSHRYSSPPHCHFSWICTQAKDSQPSVVIIVDFQTQSMRWIQEQSDSQQMNWVAFLNVTPAAVYAAFITYSFL